MEASDWVTLIGVALTFATTTTTLALTWIRNRKSDYISKVTDYRLKWIDIARTPIAEYLHSIDKLSRGNDHTLEENYTNYLEKHWMMRSCLTTFSPYDRNANEYLNKIYSLSSELINPECRNRATIREAIGKELPDIDTTLRRLMDENWFDVKKEILKGKARGNK